MGGDIFFDELKRKIHTFIMQSYGICDAFPKTETYSTANQLKRAAVSIMLTYVEGYGRRKIKVKLNFFEISYGSTRECKYLLFLAFEKEWISKQKYDALFEILDQIAAMLWSMIVGTEKKIKDNE
jgi:four helix bundle protein